jgi:hypothetical protein
VRRYLDPCTCSITVPVTAVAGPSGPGGVQIGVCRHHDGQAGLPDLPIASIALPAVSVASGVGVERPHARGIVLRRCNARPEGQSEQGDQESAGPGSSLGVDLHGWLGSSDAGGAAGSKRSPWRRPLVARQSSASCPWIVR